MSPLRGLGRIFNIIYQNIGPMALHFKTNFGLASAWRYFDTTHKSFCQNDRPMGLHFKTDFCLAPAGAIFW